jgi:toxin FitB
MSFLLDTNVVSELVRPSPDPGVTTWIAGADEDRIFLSVATIAEIRYGIERMAAGSRRNRLDQWLRNELAPRFEGRLLPIDHAIADAWGRIFAHSNAIGRPMEAMDAMIAATVKVHGLTLVTRNAADFRPILKDIVNPWTGS